MSLYDDDIETEKATTSGWASGIKLMQHQLAFKKAAVNSQSKRDPFRKGGTKLAPVIDLKSRSNDDDATTQTLLFLQNRQELESGGKPFNATLGLQSSYVSSDCEWKFTNEYNPFWPNDYEKVVQELRDKRDRDEGDHKSDKRFRDREDRIERGDRERNGRRKERNCGGEESGFSHRRDSDEEAEIERTPRRGGGAAIAPPPSLDEGGSPSRSHFRPPPSFAGTGGSIAAKIMAKYGFKEGQGLGRSEQGIVTALQVEKTSKRGGRIVRDQEEGSASPPIAMPPPLPVFAAPLGAPPLRTTPQPQQQQERTDASMGNLLKNPSKVALLRNMAGPGEVDDDLEPEVRDECSGKYGPVVQVVIFEIPKAPPDEAVRIFVEFQRIESTIKAIIDLNGRFFGGRQVKAGFYDYENFKALKLNEAMP